MRIRADLRQKVVATAVEWNGRCDHYEAGGAALCNGVATGLLMALDIIGEQREEDHD